MFAVMLGCKLQTVMNQKKSSPRIPLQPRAIEEPDDTQLVFWSLREGILQHLSPSEMRLHPSRISLVTMARLRSLYCASLVRFKQRKLEEQKQARIRHPIRQELATWFANNLLLDD